MVTYAQVDCDLGKLLMEFAPAIASSRAARYAENLV
jgi:hypothetical protein